MDGTANLLTRTVDADTGGRPRLVSDDPLGWLRSLPGYRELIRARISAAAKARAVRVERVERSRAREYASEPRQAPTRPEPGEVERGLREMLSAAGGDVDRLGREVEGCG